MKKIQYFWTRTFINSKNHQKYMQNNPFSHHYYFSVKILFNNFINFYRNPWTKNHIIINLFFGLFCFFGGIYLLFSSFNMMKIH